MCEWIGLWGWLIGRTHISGNSGHVTTNKRYGFSMENFNKVNEGCLTLKKGPNLLSLTKERVSAFFQGKAPLVISPGKFNYIIRVLEGMGETTLKRWLEEHLRGCELEVQISRDTLLSAGSFIKRANQNPVIISINPKLFFFYFLFQTDTQS